MEQIQKAYKSNDKTLGFLHMGLWPTVLGVKICQKIILENIQVARFKKLQLLTCACCEVVSGISSIEKTG